MLKRGIVPEGWCLVLAVALTVTGCHQAPKPLPELTTESVTQYPEIAPPAPLDSPPALPGASVGSLPPPSVSAPLTEGEDWISLAPWCQRQGLTLDRLPVNSPDHIGFRISRPGGLLELWTGTRRARFNGVEFYLGVAPGLTNDLAFLTALDARKNLQPLLQPSSPNPFRRGIIVLDPGHGGRDVGTKGALAGQLEKNLTLDWARRLQSLLVAKGWRVVLTRNGDVDLGLSDRVAIANLSRADLFLSLHFNSGPNRDSLSGIETYCLTPAGLPSTLVRFESDDPSVVHPNNAYDELNLMLAYRLHGALLKKTGAADRGIRRARFMTVLQGQTRPAVLIEGGFLSNAAEASKLTRDGNYRQLLAEAVASALP